MNRNQISVLILCFFFAFSLRPIILVPGLSATAFYATLNKTKSHSPSYCKKKASKFRIWVSIEEIVQPLVNCFIDNMRLHFDKEKNTYSNTEGVTIEPIDWEGVKGIDYLDYVNGYPVPGTIYMSPLIEMLKKNGYKVGENLFGAPYDWRYPPDFYSKIYPNRIQNLVEKAYEKNKEKVIFLGHSMANTHLTWFFNKMVSSSWKEKYIDRYIAISGPLAGAPGPLRSILSGSNDQFTFGWISIISNENTKKMYRTWGSFLGLIPHGGEVYGDDPIVQIINNNNSKKSSYQTFDVSQIHELLMKTDDPNLPIMFQNENELRKTALKDPEVPVFCMYSILGPNSTEISYIYEQEKEDDSSNSNGDIFQKEPKIKFGSGDGSVPEISLSQCKKWNSTRSVLTVQGIRHKNTVSDPKALKLIWELINTT